MALSANPRSKRRKNVNQQQVTQWQQWTHFAGLDWAKDHHDVVVVDRLGQIVLQLRISEDAVGWQHLREKLQEFSKVAVAIETSHGAVVERLLQLQLPVYPVNPKAAKQYRNRKAPSGTKTDFLDGWSLADALRVDGHGWRRLMPEDPLLQELRLLCRDEIHLIEQRTALVNQLQQALAEYYPAALKAFDDWTMPATWAFVEQFPTPETLLQAGRRRWEKFLHVHKLYRPQTYQKRLEQFAAATQFSGPQAVVNAKSRLAVTLAKQLRVLERQLEEYRARITELFGQHPDRDLFGSLPGVGGKLAPRLLSECGDDRGRFEDAQSLQCYAGTAPVSYQSGQLHKVHFRRACNKYLRSAVHLWANLSRSKCAWAGAYYRQKRQEGKSHACALRCLGQRWLKILWKMWQSRSRYDEQLHACNQVRHGSWVITLSNPAATA
jgi:transposase